ncbi:MAG: hypothetical protein QXQ94_02170 [Candidatus Bathyarchaeia archaeon]
MMITIHWRTVRKIWRELAGKKPSPQTRHISINGHDVVEVIFTEEQANVVIERADIKGTDAIKKGKKGPIVTLNPMHLNRVGFLGQVAFYIYAFADFKKGLELIKIGYQPDITDVVFKGYQIDIKTRSKHWHDWLMVPEFQFKNKLHDFYVGCRLMRENPYIIQIWGYATRKELEEVEPSDKWGYDLTRAIPFKNLHPVIELRDLRIKKPLQSFF